MKEKKITPHIPVWDKSKRDDGTFSRSDFNWDKRRGLYVCPNGKTLRTSGTVTATGHPLYRASKLRLRRLPAEGQVLPEACRRAGSRATSTRTPATWRGGR